jgi:hypothetical protein
MALFPPLGVGLDLLNKDIPLDGATSAAARRRKTQAQAIVDDLLASTRAKAKRGKTEPGELRYGETVGGPGTSKKVNFSECLLAVPY